MGSDYALSIILFLAAHTIAFITICVTIYVRAMTKMKELEVRIKAVESNETKIFDKLDELLTAVHQLALKIEHKNNRQ